MLDAAEWKQVVWTSTSVDIAGYNTKRTVTDEYQKKPYTKSPKKLLRKNFNNTSKEIKLYMLKDESVKPYSSNAYSIDRSSNTLSRNNTHSSNNLVYS